MSDNIKVVVKVRPLISREIEEKLSYQWRVKNNTLYQIDQNGKDLGQAFTFDKVYDEKTETSDVYNDIAKPIVQAATGGFNGTIFAYGQTSSGKTYTMTGTDRSPGIIPLAVLNLFEIIKSIPDRDFLVRVSYIEIYNETVKDLLNVDNNNIKIHETLQGIKVDATEKVTSSPDEVLEAMKEGEANRQKGATNMNEQSSRSHSIFQITIESREHIEGESEGGCVNVSQLNLVDLAGSERAGQTGATGLRFKEGTHINKSLSALALVIKQLSDDPNKYANYRDSKLTRILQNSLGGNAKTSIICAVTPAAVEETISTLQFANRAKAIKNKPEVNAVATDATMIQSLTKQMSKLQSQLESKKNLEQDNYNLQRQINALQKLILNGFAQRRSIDVLENPRRKLQAPRRVTIHSTLTSIDDEPVINVPKFCTPSLKYNPMAFPNPSDFVPIQSSNKLASVPEEPARLITPPPNKAVNFNDEIITLDSDDEATPGSQETCSPIHKCYGASKTPPCVLRKNCKIAEKNLKDIVELTEREKIYAPSTVELIEKIEQNSNIIAKLQDEIELLNKRSKEKDMQVELLKNKIQKNDDELKALCSAKDDLQSQCDSYSTKLTDWEVSYETLKTRAKLREEELLSLLEEVKVKKPQEIGKVLSRTFEKDIPFMDMSKDISLVNSDNENPEDEAEEINNIITETQKELACKNINIVELEAKLFANKQEIESLENLNEQLEQTVFTFKEKLSAIENENNLLKSSIDSLNTTISNQRQNLESANNDIKSYQHVIQELQIKLTQKDNVSDIRIDDSVLEEMITNEKHFIANNENMMNIVHSFKIALDTRNKEIAELRNKINNESVPDKTSLIEELQTKTDQINMLHETVEDLKKQLNENVGTVRKLMHEKGHFQTIEQELIAKLDDFENKYSELEKNYNESNLSKVALEDKNNEMSNQIEDLNNKLAYLEDSVDKKIDLINSLNKDVTESRENLFKANIAVIKTKSILGSLSGNIAEVPDIMDNFVNIFSDLTNSLNTLEIAASDVVTEKQELNQVIENLKAEMEQLSIKHESEVAMLQEEIEGLKRKNDDLKEKLNEAIEIRDLGMSLTKSKTEQLEQSLTEKDNEICNLTSKLNDMENQLKEKISEINNYEGQLNKEDKEEQHLLTNISKKITDITNNFNIENQFMEDILDSVQIYEHILFTLDQIASHITFISQKNDDDDGNQATELIKLQNKILELTQENYDLTASLSEVVHKNSELKAAVDVNQDNNKKLSDSLKGSQELLHDLHTELTMKDTELQSMNEKVREFKMQFETLDLIMKEQMEEIKRENKNLVTRVNNLKRQSKSPDFDRNACDDGDQDIARTKDSIAKVDTSSPPSLLTICCNKIVDHMEPKESESKTSTNLSADIEIQSELNICKCKQLELELKGAEEENSKILDLMAQLEIVNEKLLEEQDIIRSEIQLLLEPAQELQKKILNHRTNLSILTATTYTENKSLQSQVKVLQHHHKRFHTVCQRDIPDFKKQLNSLMTLLKGDVSICDQQNLSFKRYSLPDVLDSNTSIANFKNESTLDGDLLMLDTNVTLTTAADNTLAGHDQTCLDMTQYYTEACCQTTDENAQQIEILNCEVDIIGKLSILQEENSKLRALVEKYSEVKQAAIVADAQNGPVRNNSNLEESARKSFITNENSVQECAKCKELFVLQDAQEKLNDELKALGENLINVKSQKAELEEKYNNLILEQPSTEVLIKKLSIYEKEFNSQKQEISKLNETININNKKLRGLQEENDTLSSQVMENISEVDDLQKVLDNLKQRNIELEGKCNQLEQSKIDHAKAVVDICAECIIKDKLIQTLEQSKTTKTHARLNRSLSDSDTSSRYNKICTLQSELHAGREDCKELTEDVATIKNHLERSNLSMDLDESIGDANIYTLTKDYEVLSPQSKKCNMPDIAEECTKDIYMLDKIDCYNYYVEKTGSQRNNISPVTRIVEFMKMLYNHLTIKHGNEVENLTNRLKDYEEEKSQLQSQYNSLVEKYSDVTKEFQAKQECSKIESTLSQLRHNISVINEELTTVEEADNTKLLNLFKENLDLLDSEFSLTSANIFELLINKMVNKQQAELTGVMSKYTKLQADMEHVSTELNTVTNNVLQIKTQLSTKENEYNLLKAQKERVHEISNAVTLDIVKREKELKDTIDNGYQRLIELNIVKKENVDSNLPLNTNINVLFELLVTQNDSSHDENNDKEILLLEINNLNKIVEEKQKEIDVLKIRCEKMQEVNNGVTLDLVDKESKLQTLRAAHDELNKTCEVKLQENKFNLLEIEKLTQEINTLRANIVEKENIIERLEKKSQSQHEASVRISELIDRVSNLHNENENLKKLNDIINKEKDSYAEELLKSGETIKKSNIDIDKMTSDILVLRESVRENSAVIESLTAETKSLMKQNLELKEQLEYKNRECSRLETNIKTHEKTAQIQARMITRIEKQKSDDEKALIEAKQQLEEITQKYVTLQKEREDSKTEIEQMKNTKETLEARVSELEGLLEGQKNRLSIDAISDSSRRRRRSLHDSKRIFAEEKHDGGDHTNAEALFGSRAKPDDLFMDVDDEGSNRSTPIRLSKGRDSLSVSKTDQTKLNNDKMRRKLQVIQQGKVLSDKDDEPHSRPSSVIEIRRRRQTLHDSHRSELSHTPSPHAGNDSTVSQLRERLASCQQELEELKEKYRELDEECETCAEYLRERDAQCSQLKKDKISLQTQITELKERLQSSNPNVSSSKAKVAHASVNTDEDWANLHSVVVDRMSYDAEVEKNKKLTKTIEELRFKQQDLKNTLAKMQKALEKNMGNRELEFTKSELEACRQELSELKERYKELDEECETCARYLRDQEEQCRRLKEAKTQLEAKLQEYQSDVTPVTHTTRKRRQSAHDLNRAAAVDVTDAGTETSDDLLSYQVERDRSTHSQAEDKHAKEVQYLKLAVERLTQQKSLLEQQFAVMQPALPPMYVATGSAIVQNQQITDVMKENHKLKKINAKLINLCKKRGKESNRENEDPGNQG